jgi:glycosyltransferase involved in cell wall biosynthesis
MRIAFVIDHFFSDPSVQVNGSQIQISRIGAEMVRRGHEVMVFTQGNADILAVPDNSGGLPVTYRAPHRFSGILDAVSAHRQVAGWSPDVVYTRGRTSLAGMSARWAGDSRPVFVWASNGEEGLERWNHGTRTRRSSKPGWKKVLLMPLAFVDDLAVHAGIRHADVVVNQTEHQRQRARVVFGRDGVIVRSGCAVPEGIPDKPTPPIVVWVGRVEPNQKNPEAFIELAARCADLDARFVLVGGSRDRDYYEQLVGRGSDLPHFEHTGEVSPEEADRWIREASALVNTSTMEGVSNALVQAWAHGTPTLVLGMDPEGVIASEGLGYASGSTDRMTADLRELLSDPVVWAGYSTRAHDYAMRNHDIRAVADAYENLFREGRSDR